MPEYVQSVLKTLIQHGFEGYMVGGCVRDQILGKRPGDWDIATNALPSDVSRLFERTVPTGVKHGTVTVLLGKNKLEVTTYRTESGYSDGRRPDSVKFVSDLEEDLSRRDFTINAMAMDIYGNITDPYGGKADLDAKIIRCVGDARKRFDEDALRMLRALRFAAVLGFNPTDDVLCAIKDCAFKINAVSAERVRDETLKILMTPRAYYLEHAIDYGLFDRYIEKTVNKLNLKRLNRLTKSLPLRIAGFCALLSENGAVSDTEKFLRDLRLDMKTIKTVSRGIILAAENRTWNKYEIKKGLFENGKDTMFASAAAVTVLRGGNPMKLLRDTITSGECYEISRLSLKGQDILDLGAKEGNKVGEILNLLMEYVFKYPEHNQKEILLKIAAEKIDRE